MNIAIDITEFSQKMSGVMVYITHILNILQSIDHNNNYYLFSRYDTFYKPNNPKWRVIVHGFPRFKGSQILWYNIIFPLLLKMYRIDILWAYNFISPKILPKKLKVFVTIYDCTYVRYPETMNPQVKKSFDIYFKSTIFRSSCVFTISNFILKELLKYYPIIERKRKIIAHCGIPDWSLESSYNPYKREEYLFFVGNLEPRKNLSSIIKALEILYEEGNTINLYIAGPTGWKNDTFHKYLVSSKIKNQITLLGYLTNQQLQFHYSNCKAFIFPSLYEGFGMPVLEALLMDCLVITSKNSVMEEICENAAIYSDPTNIKELSESIKGIYSKDFNRNKYLQHRQKILSKYSWKKTAEIILNTFNNYKL